MAAGPGPGLPQPPVGFAGPAQGPVEGVAQSRPERAGQDRKVQFQVDVAVRRAFHHRPGLEVPGPTRDLGCQERGIARIRIVNPMQRVENFIIIHSIKTEVNLFLIKLEAR